MRYILLGALTAMVLSVFLLSSPSGAVPTTAEDKTLSPYFLVTGDDAEVDQFSLESTSADVNIAGVIADVVVTQVYKNDGKKPIEAIYIFPASTRAAVYGMKMTIGERTIVAKIKEKEKARQEYEQAKEEGKSASLLEQRRPNVFQMNVANILPGDRIVVELKYTELLVPTDGIYEFSYPTVVGPRYSNQPEASAPASESWVKNPYLHEGEDAPYGFGIKVNISAGLPIGKISCDTHKVDVTYDGKADAKIELDPSDKKGGNRDFILQYQLQGGKIESGLILYEGKDENFFLLMTQPPEKISESEIPPREYVFIVDVSGSMNGFPLDISKKLLSDLIGGLKPTDRFNVLLFASSNTVMSEKSLPANERNVQKAIDVIDNQQGGGGTELLPALKRAMDLPGTEGFSRTIIIVTDGYVSVEKEAFDLIRDNLNEANVFAFGIGSSVNRFIIEGMARVGMGEPYIITEPGKAKGTADKFRKLISTPALTNVEIDYGSFKVYDVEPPSVPDVLAERPVVVFGKYKGSPKGEIKLTGKTGEGEYSQTIDVASANPRETNAALRYLWARQRITVLDDYNQLAPNDERVKEVTDLGLTYNLLTAYTSFVAIDSEVRLKDGKATTVKQPLPLPQGVSDYAVGSSPASGRGFGGAMRMKSMAPAKSAYYALGEECFDEGPSDDKDLSATIVKVETNSLSESAVRKAIEAKMADIDVCLSSAVSGSGISGKLELKIEIDSNGKVVKVEVVKDELSSKRLEKCVMEIIKKISFPAPSSGGETITVTLDMQ